MQQKKRGPRLRGDKNWFLLILCLWLVAALIYWWIARDRIVAWSFPDPDDQLRLQQVRDWLGGQSWFDVSQYRINPPGGVQMHWSRLVDLPIAAAILLARPFASAHGAELFACVAVPLVTLGAAMLLAGLLARRLIGDGAGLAAAALTPITTGALMQMRVLRIDHHGWQMVLALGLALALLDRRPLRSGLLAAACAAGWLAISLEGLPLAVAAAAILGLRWLRDPARERVRLGSYVIALAGLSAVGYAALHGLDPTPRCDALGPLQLLPLAIAALGAGIVLGLNLAKLPSLALLGATAVIAAFAYRVAGPQCASGAFAGLDPLVYRYWYLNVSEGLPVWRVPAVVAASAIGFPPVGLAGGVLAWRRGTEGWGSYALLLAAATLVTAFMQRAGGAANLLALPGGVWLMAGALARAQRIRSTLPRVFGSAAALLALTPLAPALTVAALPRKPAPAAKPDDCATTANFATAARLPQGTLFTGIEIGPGIVFTTRQSVVASAHHRNVAGLHDVIAAFMGTPPQARAILARHRSRYIVTCPASAEMDIYREQAPAGLWARLAAGRPPAWARPVRLPGSTFAIWEIAG